MSTSQPYLLISDLHFSVNRIEDLQKSCEWVLDILRKDVTCSIKHVFILGDVFESVKNHDVWLIKMYIDIFFHQVVHFKHVILHCLLGNHDFPTQTDDHSVHPFRSYQMFPHSQIRIYSEVTMLSDLHVLICPFYRDQSKFIVKELQKIRIEDQERAKIVVMGHFDVGGALMTDRERSHDKTLTSKTFEGFRQVFSGHFHKRQKVGKNLMYVGSLQQMNFTESDDLNKGALLYYYDNNKIEELVNPYAGLFMTIPFSEKEESKEERSLLTGKSVRVLYDPTMINDAQISVMKSRLSNVVKKIRGAPIIVKHRELLPPQQQQQQTFVNDDGDDNNDVRGDGSVQLSKKINQFMHSYIQTCPVGSHDRFNYYRDYIQSLLNDISVKTQEERETSSSSFSVLSFRSVTISNFFSVGGKTPVTIDFSSMKNGVWLIEGKNGMGKSTLFEAIYWCLFNAFIRFTDAKTGNMICVNRSYPDQCAYVQIVFSDGSQLTRTSSSSSNPVFMNSMNESQPWKCPLDKDTFLQSILLTQTSKIKSFMQMNIAEKKIMVEQLYGLHELSACKDEVKNRYSTVKSRKKEEEDARINLVSEQDRLYTSFVNNVHKNIERVTRDMEHLQEEMDTLLSEKEDLANSENETKTLQNQLSAKKQRLLALNQRNDATKQAMITHQQTKDTMLIEISKHEDSFLISQKQLDKITSEYDRLQPDTSIVIEIQKAESDICSIEKECNMFEKANLSISKREERLQQEIAACASIIDQNTILKNQIVTELDMEQKSLLLTNNQNIIIQADQEIIQNELQRINSRISLLEEQLLEESVRLQLNKSREEFLTELNSHTHNHQNNAVVVKLYDQAINKLALTFFPPSEMIQTTLSSLRLDKSVQTSRLALLSLVPTSLMENKISLLQAQLDQHCEKIAYQEKLQEEKQKDLLELKTELEINQEEIKKLQNLLEPTRKCLRKLIRKHEKKNIDFEKKQTVLNEQREGVLLEIASLQSELSTRRETLNKINVQLNTMLIEDDNKLVEAIHQLEHQIRDIDVDWKRRLEALNTQITFKQTLIEKEKALEADYQGQISNAHSLIEGWDQLVEKIERCTRNMHELGQEFAALHFWIEQLDEGRLVQPKKEKSQKKSKSIAAVIPALSSSSSDEFILISPYPEKDESNTKKTKKRAGDTKKQKLTVDVMKKLIFHYTRVEDKSKYKHDVLAKYILIYEEQLKKYNDAKLKGKSNPSSHDDELNLEEEDLEEKKSDGEQTTIDVSSPLTTHFRSWVDVDCIRKFNRVIAYIATCLSNDFSSADEEQDFFLLELATRAAQQSVAQSSDLDYTLSYSQGEKCKSQLVMFLAWMHVSFVQHQHKCHFLFLDEGADSLDSASVDRLIAYLCRDAEISRCLSKVFVVSHHTVTQTEAVAGKVVVSKTRTHGSSYTVNVNV